MSDKLAKSGGDLVVIDDTPRVLTAANIKAQVNLIQDVMKTVMKDGIHYGKIPGTPKPTLLKPGAEKLMSTFRIACEPEVEDLSTDDAAAFRVRALGMAIGSGEPLGSALGYCSSDEEKYKWRAAKVKAEFEETPEDRRREAWKKGREGKWGKVPQVRTQPADMANTVLKMAVKRAQIALTLQVLAASDIFAQDFEEWTPEMLAELAGDEGEIQQPKRKSEAPPPEAPKPAPAPPKAAPKPTPAPAPAPPAADEVPWPDEKDAPQATTGSFFPDDDEAMGEEIEDPGTFITYIAEVVELKSGTSKAGRPWTLYKVKTGDDDSFTTFDKGLADMARKAAASRKKVQLSFEQSGQNSNLTALLEVE